MRCLSVLDEILHEEKRAVLSLTVGTVFLIIALLFNDLGFLLAVPIILCGIPIIFEAFKGLLVDHDVTADVLVSIAMMSSVAIGEYMAAAEVALIMCLGELLEESTVSHAKSGIKQIIEMAPVTAEVVKDGTVKTCPMDDVRVNDIVRIKPGECIPVDGQVTYGSTYVDRSLLNGEPVPVAVNVGDDVSSGTMNTLGSIDVRVTAIGKDSTIGRISDLLKNADAGKSKIAHLADRAAKYIVAGAFTMAILAYILTGDIIRSVTVLVVFCPCAFVLATPTAIMAATSNLSKKGILVKEGGAIEKMAGIDTMMLDKTGTITTGEVRLLGFEYSGDGEKTDAFRMIASLEALSEHPFGKAVADVNDGPFMEVQDFIAMPGFGVKGTVDGHGVMVGNMKLMDNEDVVGFEHVSGASMHQSDLGNTVVFASIDNECVGYLVLADCIKEGASEAVRELKELGVDTIMLTGDNEKAAKAVANAVGVSDTVWECLPDTKLDVIKKLEDSHRICMVGDGINDAPSLKRADVGICMGRKGKGMAIDAADIIFLEDDVSKLPGLTALSRRTLITIKIGMTFSMTVNIIGVVLAVAGLMGPIAGALLHNTGSLLVIGSAAMLIGCDAWSGKK